MSAQLNDADSLLESLLGTEKPFEVIDRTHYRTLKLAKGFESNLLTIIPQIPGKEKTPKPWAVWVSGDDVAAGAEQQAAIAQIYAALAAAGGKFRFFPASRMPANLVVQSSDGLYSALRDLGVETGTTALLDFIEVFESTTVSAMSAQTRTSYEFDRFAVERAEGPAGGFTGLIEFSGGGVVGSACITLSQQSLLSTMSRMLDKQITELDEAVMGGPCELINIIAGVARGTLNGLGFEIRFNDLPQIYPPEFQDMLSVRGETSRSVMLFKTPEGPVMVELNFFMDAPAE